MRSAWTASSALGDTSWHAVNRLGHGVLPTACGAWLYGPFHVRRMTVPVELRGHEARPILDRDVCTECAAAMGVEAWTAVGLMGLRQAPTVRTQLWPPPPDSDTGKDPTIGLHTITWPTQDPDTSATFSSSADARGDADDRPSRRVHLANAHGMAA